MSLPPDPTIRARYLRMFHALNRAHADGISPRTIDRCLHRLRRWAFQQTETLQAMQAVTVVRGRFDELTDLDPSERITPVSSLMPDSFPKSDKSLI